MRDFKFKQRQTKLRDENLSGRRFKVQSDKFEYLYSLERTKAIKVRKERVPEDVYIARLGV